MPEKKYESKVSHLQPFIPKNKTHPQNKLRMGKKLL
jgi:hypothetical protein